MEVINLFGVSSLSAYKDMFDVNLKEKENMPKYMSQSKKKSGKSQIQTETKKTR